MQVKYSSKSTHSFLFFDLLIYTLVFIFIEGSLWFNLHDHFLDQIIISIPVIKEAIAVPERVWFMIAFYLAKLIALHFVWLLIIWQTSILSGSFLEFTQRKTRTLALYLWFVSVICLLTTNLVLFPHSLFSPSIFPILLVKIIMYASSLAILFFIVIALMQLYKCCRIYCHAYVLVGIGSLVIFSLASIVKATNTVDNYLYNHKQPNVIIIGIDDIRPRQVHYFGYPKNQTPYLDGFLARSTVFTKSITPEARTFIAWASILTGQYPVHNKIRENSQNINNIFFSNSLGTSLQKAGYKTIFAMDDISFVNLTDQFSFDKIISPPTGAETFLLDTMTDFPLINVLVNSKIGRLLFPYNYANRKAGITYEPATFNKELYGVLDEKTDQPIFLAVHFCLAHWPYIFAQSPIVRINKATEASKQYDVAVQGVDQQFHDFMNILQQKHLLDNAIVVVLSDHGEAFGLPEDILLDKKTLVTESLPPINLSQLLKPSFGHGTSTLSFTQYNNLLAIRCFGFCHNIAQKIPFWVSLIDIKPTILELLHLPSTKTDGISLIPYLKNHGNFNKNRLVFAETGFSPVSILSTQYDMGDILLEAGKVFTIDPKTTELDLKPAALEEIIKQKERAVYYRDWELTSHPEKNGQIPILINMKTLQWTTDLTTTFAQKSPAKKMWLELKKMYQDEV